MNEQFDKNKLKKVLSTIIAIILVIAAIFGISSDELLGTNNKETTTQIIETTTAIDIEDMPVLNPSAEATISNEVIELFEDTEEKVESGKDIATDEIIDSNVNEEKEVYDEGLLENDGTVEQDEISYDGTNTGKGIKLLTGTPKLTYYSQADSRWGSIMYSNHGDKSQTIRSSGCGPTSAAMIVSASKGIIIPPTMAQIFNDNGFRSSNNGTYWSAWPFVADFFDFKEYHPTSSFSTMKSYITQDKNKDGISDYFVVVSCGYGLWTTGGHYICIMDYIPETDEFVGYDPYFYTGKFNTASRRPAKVRTKDNIAYIKSSAFKTYSNAKNYWVYSNDSSDYTNKKKDKSRGSQSSSDKLSDSSNKVKYIRYVNTKNDPLNVRSGPGTKYKIIRQLLKGSKVNVCEEKNGWSRISTKDEWVSSDYLSKTKSITISKSYSTTVGKYYCWTTGTTIYSKSNQSGTSYNYKAQTRFKVLSHDSYSEDYIYIPATGRYAHWKVTKNIKSA